MRRSLTALCVGVAVGIAVYTPATRLSLLDIPPAPERPACPVATAEQCGTGVRVLFVGDLMLDRNVGKSAEAEGVEALFSTSTRELFADADVRVANLEGTITTNPSIARVNNKILHFTFNPTTAEQVLGLLQLTAVSLANNHSLDFGTDGYNETQNSLDSTEVAFFGHPYNLPGKVSTVVESNGKLFCFVGYHALFVSTTTPIVDEVKTLRPDCWRVIVFALWGEEYETDSNAAQHAAAHAFIDAGADLVVGAHPHVVQDYEVYKGKAVFYSLGNFMFDQNFSWNTMHGLAVRADFYEDKTDFTLTPMDIIEQHSSVATSTVAEFSLP